MSFFDGGDWQHDFSFPEGWGCGFTLLGFALFVAAVFMVKHFFFL
jgi:hypothetical protein